MKKNKRQKIGELEELILLVVGILNDNAYGISIKEEVEKQSGRPLSISAVHAVLLRLEEKELLKSWMGGETKERGGRRKRFFQVTGLGRKTLIEVRELRTKLWNLMPDFS